MFAAPWKEDIFASFLERMVRYRDVQEGETHRSDIELFGESTTSNLDVGWLNGYESVSIIQCRSRVTSALEMEKLSRVEQPRAEAQISRSADVDRTFLSGWKRRVS